MTTKTVYVVDDDPLVRRVIRLALEREGYNVEVCEDGQEGLERVRESAPDALVSDICRSISVYICGWTKRRIVAATRPR